MLLQRSEITLGGARGTIWNHIPEIEPAATA